MIYGEFEMTWKSTVLASIPVTLLLGLGVLLWAQGQTQPPDKAPSKAAPSPADVKLSALQRELEPLQYAEAVYNVGLSFEAGGDLAQAATYYQEVKKRFPNHPLAGYRLAICWQNQGKTKDAIGALRQLVAAKNGPKELLDDARERLQAMLMPVLTPAQQEALDHATDSLQMAEELKKPPPDGEKANDLHLVPLQNALNQLERLRKERADYLPLYFRLGIAYEHLGRHLDAYSAYDRYLTGYEALKLPITAQQREIRQRMVVCEAILRLRVGQFVIQTSYRYDLFVVHSFGVKGSTDDFVDLRSVETNWTAAKFTLVRGLVDGTDFSIESNAKPGHYMMPIIVGGKPFELVFAPATTPESKSLAVFKMVNGLEGKESSGASFESRYRPGWFICAPENIHRLSLREREDTEAFRKAVTFRFLGPASPSPPSRSLRIQRAPYKGWVQLFNGKDLTGWKTHPKNPGDWSVEDGVLVGKGKQTSHLFSERGDYENFHYRIEAKISDKGNSGQYFRAEFAPGFPSGYEAQINSTFPGDPQRTGSLYNFSKVTEMLVPPDTWFTQEVIAVGNHIIIKVNDKTVVDFVDKKNTHTKGHFAIQQHPPGRNAPDSVIMVKTIAVKELPSSSK
jgi:3-keto-disaccharide hydrolase/tetratricopeptide repeat protein